MAWAEALPHLPKPGAPPAGGQTAITAWNLMGGEIDWSALPFVVELLGVLDVTELIYSLIAIREHQARQAEAERR